MNATEAALEAARYGLIGTIAVGLLAAITTLVGTLVAPFMIRRSEAKTAHAHRRRDELIDIIPDVIVKSIRAGSRGADADTLAAGLGAQAKLGVMLHADEWQIAAIAREGLMLGPQDIGNEALKRAGAAANLLPMWARGEITPSEAEAMFERDTGVKVTRPMPPNGN